MVNITQIRRYAWVVDLLMNRKKLSIKEINYEWQRSSISDNKKEDLDRKVWYSCFDDIGMIYGIIIESDKKSKNSKWFIVNPEALRGRDVQQWMLACVAHRNLLEECMGLRNRTDIEGFPSENGMLEPIVEAMKGNWKMEVIYRRYGYNQPKQHIVEPYFIKTYNHRFYVLCKFDTGHFFTLSFDRMLQVKVLKEHFNFPQDLFAQDFFWDSFGVVVPNNGEKPIDIIVRAKMDARYYLEDTPLHHSQKVVKEEKDYTDFSVHIVPTEDFFGSVMHQGDRLEILSPNSMRQHITERLQKALAPYLLA